MPPEQPDDVTQVLARAARGDDSAVAVLLPLVYDSLRALAGSFFRQQQADHTLQPTALVHEAYVKLLGSTQSDWENRAHFFAVAAKAMRQILADHARAKKTAKRGGPDRKRVTLSGLKTPPIDREIDIVALEDALAELGRIDPRQCRVVELRFLAGLSVDDTARVLKISAPTVKREWRMARAWLQRELDGDAAP